MPLGLKERSPFNRQWGKFGVIAFNWFIIFQEMEYSEA
jgi:hypothetical protein